MTQASVPPTPTTGGPFPLVKAPWSNVAQTSIYGPYNEAKQFRLLLRLWIDDAIRAEFLSDPKGVLRREASLDLPAAMRVNVVEDRRDLFHFVLPLAPVQEEFNLRYQQISNWWMLAHYLATRQLRDGMDIAAVDGFRQALQVMIIGKTWFDPAFKQAMLRDAKSELERETGANFPPSLVIKAIADTKDEITIAVPKAPHDEDLLEEKGHLASWFLAGHGTWYFLVLGRLLRPLPPTDEDKFLA
jgi:hypothetical protein